MQILSQIADRVRGLHPEIGGDGPRPLVARNPAHRIELHIHRIEPPFEVLVAVPAVREQPSPRHCLAGNPSLSTTCWVILPSKNSSTATGTSSSVHLFMNDSLRLICSRNRPQPHVKVSERVVSRITTEEGLAVCRPKKRRCTSYKGEIGDVPENLVKRLPCRHD